MEGFTPFCCIRTVSKLYLLALLEIPNWRKQIPQVVNKKENRNEEM
jgi:hypothetical protein